MKTESVVAIIGAIGTILCSKPFRKAMFGTYTDGTPRSLTDALDGNFRSPKEKGKNGKKSSKGKKKKHKGY